MKRRLTATVDLDVDLLPVNEDVLAYCKRAKAGGRKVWLVSAADQKDCRQGRATLRPV